MPVTLSQKRMITLVVFAAGLTTLGLEMIASRLLSPVFGTSNLIWANIIGLIMLYLTLGYWLGGRLADRSPHPATFYQVILWGAFTAGLIPVVAGPVLRWGANAMLSLDVPVVVGSFAVTLILFIVPVTLLGAVSPFAVRLMIDDAQSAGRVAGRLSAISTVGSLFGTFLPNLLLVPLIGTRSTFFLLSGFLLLLALAGLFMVDRRRALLYLLMPAVLLGLFFLKSDAPLRPAPLGAELLYEDESAYNYIQVSQLNKANILMLNEGLGIHSMYWPDYPDYIETGGTWDYYLAAPFFNEPPHTMAEVGSLAVIGLAGGTTPKQYTQIFGPIPIDGMDIDGDIIEVGREYFGMTEQNLTIIVEDGRLGLAQADNTYDVVAVDAYKLPYIPAHLSTVEFFTEVRDHLNPNGVVAINVGRTSGDRTLIDAFTATLLEVYPSVHVIDVPYSCNSIMVATLEPTSPENLLINRALLPDDAHPLLATVLERAYDQIQPLGPGGVVLTDDKAPVELLTDFLVVKFALSGVDEFPCQ